MDAARTASPLAAVRPAQIGKPRLLIAQSSATLSNDPANPRERMIAGIVVVAMVLGVAIDARFPSVPLAHIVALPPTVDAISVGALALTAWMLVAQYRVRRYGPYALLAGAFAAFAALVAADALLYPGALENNAWFNAGPQSGLWMRIVGRFLFASMAIAYAVADRNERRAPRSSRVYVRPAWIALGVIVVVAVLFATVGSKYLPHAFDLVGGLSPLYTRVIFPMLLSWTAFAGLVVLAVGRRGSRLRVWLCVVLAAMCGSLVAGALGETIFTSGYYVSRAYEVLGAFTFVFVVQAQLVTVLKVAQRTGERAHALSEMIAAGDVQTYAGINTMLSRVALEFAFDFVSIARLEASDFVLEFSYGLPAYPRGFRLPVEGTLAGKALETRSLVNIEDLTLKKYARHSERVKSVWASACVVPVYTQDLLYGVLTFANTKPRPQALSALERDFLRLVGILVGNALERIRQKRRLDELAYYDALTGLPNRVLLTDRIHAAIASAERNGARVAIHFLDLDDFKPINDRFGHAVGDDVLREVGRRLERSLRASDTVARYGGDEFVVVQPVVPEAGGPSELHARIAGAFREAIVVPAGNFHMSFSIGVSTFPTDGKDAHTLLIRADEAQYRAKDARRAARSNPMGGSGIA